MLNALLQRIFRRTRVEGDCRIWLGYTSPDGYGYVRVSAGKNKPVHRAVFEALNGPVPTEHDVDHMRWQRNCCEPAHLRTLPASENRRLQRKALAPNCVKGHPLIRRNGRRICKTCEAAAARRYHARKVA